MEEKGRPGNSCGLTDIAHCRRGITLRGKESYRAIVDVAAGPLALADRAAGRFLDDTQCPVITLSQPISRHPSNSYGHGTLHRKSAVYVKSLSVSVGLGGRRINKKNK